MSQVPKSSLDWKQGNNWLSLSRSQPWDGEDGALSLRCSHCESSSSPSQWSSQDSLSDFSSGLLMGDCETVWLCVLADESSHWELSVDSEDCFVGTHRFLSGTVFLFQACCCFFNPSMTALTTVLFSLVGGRVGEGLIQQGCSVGCLGELGEGWCPGSHWRLVPW